VLGLGGLLVADQPVSSGINRPAIARDSSSSESRSFRDVEFALVTPRSIDPPLRCLEKDFLIKRSAFPCQKAQNKGNIVPKYLEIPSQRNVLPVFAVIESHRSSADTYSSIEA